MEDISSVSAIVINCTHWILPSTSTRRCSSHAHTVVLLNLQISITFRDYTIGVVRGRRGYWMGLDREYLIPVPEMGPFFVRRTE